MSTLDWTIVALYLVAAIGVGSYFTKRAGRSTSDFFVAGRTLPWFIAGTSIVATTFSSDTPLVVAGISRQTGIYGHWFWLSAAIGQTATVFFFARLWRRTEVMTDIEFITKRYKPSPATSALRVFKVFFDGVLINCIVMASVTLAMAKTIKVLLNLPETAILNLPFFGELNAPDVLLLVLAAAALSYSLLSGLYGVVYTDMLQFALAMTGSIGLAVIVYADACGGTGLSDKLSSSPGFEPNFLNFFPDLRSFNLKSFTFFVYVSITWWARAPGKGYYVQRLLAARSEKDSFLAFLWFNICQYVIRPWPWIVVGLVSLYYLPNLKDNESSFPMMINLFLPSGLRGVMVAAILAAFMSTIDTHLNWGASYIINDFYRPFINAHKSTRHYIRVSRLTMLLLTIAALVVTTRLNTIIGAYKYLGLTLAGVGTVMIARWYWWRVNPYSELAAIVASLVVANLLQIKLPGTATTDLYAVRVVVTVIVVAAIWITVTFLTSTGTPERHTIDFYSKMKIPGPGWKTVRQAAQIKPNPTEFAQNLTAWVTSVAFIFSAMLGIGKLLFHQFGSATVYFSVAVTTGYLLKKLIARMKFS